MIETLKRLLSPEYLIVPDPGPLGPGWISYAVLALLFALGLGVAAWALLIRTRAAGCTALRAWAWFELWICAAGLAVVIGRFVGWPGWSARIWPYSLTTLALTGVLAYRLRSARLPPWLTTQLQILALMVGPSAPSPALSRHQPPVGFLGAAAVHLLGIGMVIQCRYGWPWWIAPLVLLALVLPQLPFHRLRQLPNLLALTPLLAAYGATLLWLLYTQLGITVIGWQGLAFPNPLASLFYVDGVILAAVTYSLLCQFHLVSGRLGPSGRLWRWATTGLLLTTLAWASVVYFGKRTHGATASDPYAYAQMAVDLAERGTAVHRYSLFEQVIPLNIAWAPLQPVGYHIPRNSFGDCPSVWPTGASLLLAAGYKLLGEAGLYVTTPFVALLALAASWLLVQEVLRGEPRPVRHGTAALTVALVATSPEQVDRLLVPMADAAAQLFTTLTLLLTLRALRLLPTMPRRGAWSMVLAGIAFGWAHWVRHTQLVLAFAVILAVVVVGRRARSSARHMGWLLLLFFGAALLAALPDIIYRWRWFGGILATETTELPSMGLHYLRVTAFPTLLSALAAGEWGYLFPLILLGAYWLARRHRQEAAVLGTAFAVVLFLHLTYRFLRLRDLISVFPLLNLAAGYGAVTLVRKVRAVAVCMPHPPHLGRLLLPSAALGWVILSLALARWAMIDNLWKPGWASFGYMRPEHRAAFDRLAALTPPEAVIGASLNAGAVMLYTGRDAVRPYDSWTDAELSIFLDAMRARGRAVYLLDDGGLMADFIDRQGAQRRLTPIEALRVPLFYTQNREVGWLYRLEWEP